ncbi:sulfite exporter TauE/SafE family protein [Gemmobacter caeruleus]|uniref:sulfite exporter TauE/SafE family protein n=1 Tax=Gemmobacter caeruleus TaxID=2595004 RepID=UPI0011ED2103|nr:sulfite exporter TauE/SafE family protein [Gemmobacter caeruleus]
MPDQILTSPPLLALCCLAVVLVGLSKGGFGGMSLMGVPILALAMPPMTAAALLLPVLVVMDAMGVWAWRRHVDKPLLRLMLPPALLGIGFGWLTAEMVSDAMVTLIVGVVSLAFVAWVLWRRWVRLSQGGRARPWFGRLCGMVAGYTSFVAHAGAPPLQIYLMPRGLDPKRFTGTSVVFFAVTNIVKLVPYAALGGFDRQILLLSAALLPLAVGSTWAGAQLVRRMRAEMFYPFTYASIALVGAKLIWDGLAGL